MRSELLGVLLLTAALAGCLGDDPEPSTSDADRATPTRKAAPTEDGDTADEETVPTHHPYPDGDEGWPGDLEGPFELGEVLRNPLEGHDGTLLETTIYLPDLPDGVEAPVVLLSTRTMNACYHGGCFPASHEEAVYHGTRGGVRPDVLVENGYAVAIVNVRGTGHSEGCYQVEGTDEQLDQATLVEALASEPWSNGHVAAMGTSTAWVAASLAPDPLKTTILQGANTDRYLGFHSPQGAAWFGTAGNSPGRALFGVVPGPGGEVDGDDVAAAELLLDRACSDVVDALTVPQRGMYTDDRAPGFWEERRHIDRLPEVRSSVLVKDTFVDGKGPYHGRFQEDNLWQVLDDDTPRRMVLAATEASVPAAGEIDGAPFGIDWYDDVVLPWLDYWLKGQGSPDALGLGTVDYQAMDGTWRTADAWPPSQARHEVLYLRPDGSIGPVAEEGARSFRSVTDEGGGVVLTGELYPVDVGTYCREVDDDNTLLLYHTEPLEEPVTIAGNPWLHLGLESSEPGGAFTVDLLVGPEDAACRPQTSVVSQGAVDLRFHDGGYLGEDFPVDQKTPVRTDLWNQALTIEPGQRLSILVWAEYSQSNPVWTPEITLHGGDGPEASHIVLPLVEGTLGGEAPILDYPPRPFLPEGAT